MTGIEFLPAFSVGDREASDARVSIPYWSPIYQYRPNGESFWLDCDAEIAESAMEVGLATRIVWQPASPAMPPDASAGLKAGRIPRLALRDARTGEWLEDEQE